MKIVIDIDEELYKKQLGSDWSGNIYIHDAIVNGTPLPKGHGRLIDADDFFCEYPELAKEPYIYAPTVIEADKDESEEVWEK